MKDFYLYKKRDGQNYKLAGTYYCADFEEAKKEFAANTFNDLLNGVHGDDFIYKDISEGVDEGGIYYGCELIMSDEELDDGIEYFSEDVYTWILTEKPI